MLFFLFIYISATTTPFSPSTISLLSDLSLLHMLPTLIEHRKDEDEMKFTNLHDTHFFPFQFHSPSFSHLSPTVIYFFEDGNRKIQLEVET